MMNLLMKIALYLHIVPGSFALLLGTVSLLSPKGGKLHRFTGRWFYYCMATVSLTAIGLSLLRDMPFFLYLGIFSFYMNNSGYRSVKRKDLKPAPFDWIVLFIALGNSLFMLSSFNVILIILGAFNALLAAGDLRLYFRLLQNRSIPGTAWARRHIGMMTGTYIAAFTAFLVVNITLAQLPWLPWLLPTFLGSPFIIFWSRKYRSKLKKK